MLPAQSIIYCYQRSFLGEADTAQALLKQGAHATVFDYFRRTALHYVCANGDHAMVQLLLDYAADVNWSE